jgi:hypothetical protein
MRAVPGTLSSIRADRGAAFWIWFSVKFVLGVSQMFGAVGVSVLYFREGPTWNVMRCFLVVAAVTTTSIILFKVLRWNPVKR